MANKLNQYWKAALILLLAGLVFLGLASCSGDSGQSITIYSGRNESLIEPILERWENQTGIKVNVKYGSSADLALLIKEEGSKSPADVFISQSPGAVGFLSDNNLLAQIPASLQQKVLPEWRSGDNTWIGITGRQRVLVYNPALVEVNDLPSSIDELTDSKYRGRVAVAPLNGSFQDFVTALRFQRGDEGASNWLEGLAANNAPNYPKNSAIVAAVVAGEVEMGLVNHYYLLRELAENPSANGVNHYFLSDDVGSLLIITAGTVLDSSDNKGEAVELLEYLLEPSEQTYFVDELREYSLIAGVPAPGGVPDLDAFSSPSLTDFGRLGKELLNTVRLIENSGIIDN